MTHPFSNEIPELLTTHLDHLKKSAISIEVMKERGYKSVLGKTPLKDLAFSKAQQRAPGILIPLHGVDGSVVGHQHRPDHPRVNPKGKAVKYENPIGSSVRLDVPPRCQKRLGDPAVPLWFTEGAKKVDALASQGACAIGLTGVWGFKGKNPLGGTTILADFDYIALKGRLIYTAFDSDSATNPQVALALRRLAEHLKRKGGKVVILQLPEGPKGEKLGVDDYLAQGHSLSDIIGLEVLEPEKLNQTLKQRSHEQYCIDAGRICWNKQTNAGDVLTPLCNFVAKVEGDILKDDGQETKRFFKVSGMLGAGGMLPPVDIPSGSFNAMNWITSEWGMKPIIAAGQMIKDRLREAIQLQSQDAEPRLIYTHTGWREVDGKHVFLTGGGAIGGEGIEVELEPPLKRYILSQPDDNPSEAIRFSLDFMFLGELKVTLPLWAAIYLAPLSEFIDPAFTLWYVGPSGAFKSVLTALALCHFGNFDYLHLPAAWRDTQNQLEKLMFLSKDIPLVIDDWAPGQDAAKARELDIKAEHIIRAQGNRQGKGRMRSDTSIRISYVPRGLLITSGEQLPAGHSQTSRIVTVEIERADVFRDLLTAAQKQSGIYSSAMSHYIAWISENWDKFKTEIPSLWIEWRDKVYNDSRHPRLPGDLACLYAGLYMASLFACERGVITDKEMVTMRETGWDIFMDMTIEQSDRIDEERPGELYMEGLRALVDQGQAVFGHKDDEVPSKPGPGEIMVGWKDNDGNMFLNPPAAYAAVHQFFQRSGRPFTFKKNAVWKDLNRMGLLLHQNGRNTDLAWIYGQAKRVLRLKKSSLDAH